jgi:hypothetical protein
VEETIVFSALNRKGTGIVTADQLLSYRAACAKSRAHRYEQVWRIFARAANGFFRPALPLGIEPKWRQAVAAKKFH